MEIEHIRKELNHLLENIVTHSNSFSKRKEIPSLEISVVLTEVNKMQEQLIVLKYLIEKQEKSSRQLKNIEKEIPIVTEIQKETLVIIEEIPSPSQSTDVIVEKSTESSTLKLIDTLTLNDRYLYANELFNKDMSSFNEFVKSIDSSSSLGDAKELLSKLNWNEENEHILSFTNLVERKFI